MRATKLFVMAQRDPGVPPTGQLDDPNSPARVESYVALDRYGRTKPETRGPASNEYWPSSRTFVMLHCDAVLGESPIVDVGKTTPAPVPVRGWYPWFSAASSVRRPTFSRA
jgi:hypothetical protein